MASLNSGIVRPRLLPTKWMTVSDGGARRSKTWWLLAVHEDCVTWASEALLAFSMPRHLPLCFALKEKRPSPSRRTENFWWSCVWQSH